MLRKRVYAYQVKNFSAIQDRSERGDAEAVNPIVDGKVACSRAYALPVFLKVWARSRPTFSLSVYKEGLALAGSGMMPKFTR